MVHASRVRGGQGGPLPDARNQRRPDSTLQLPQQVDRLALSRAQARQRRESKLPSLPLLELAADSWSRSAQVCAPHHRVVTSDLRIKQRGGIDLDLVDCSLEEGVDVARTHSYRRCPPRLLACAEFLRPECCVLVALEGLVRLIADPEFAETRRKDVLAVAEWSHEFIVWRGVP
jgi:hypothetical protein